MNTIFVIVAAPVLGLLCAHCFRTAACLVRAGKSFDGYFFGALAGGLAGLALSLIASI